MTRLHELVDLAVPAAALAVAVLVNRFDSDDRMAWLVFIGAIAVAWYVPATLKTRDFARLPLWIWVALSALLCLP